MDTNEMLGARAGHDDAALTELRRREAEGSQAAQEALVAAGFEPNYGTPGPILTTDGPAHVGPAREGVAPKTPSLLNYPTLAAALEHQRAFVTRELSRLLDEGYSAHFYVGEEDAPRFAGTLTLTGVDEGTQTQPMWLPILEWKGAEEGFDVTTLAVNALKARCDEGDREACAELDRRGIEPDVIEPEADPIAGDEAHRYRVWKVTNVSRGTEELAGYVNAADDEAATRAGGDLIGDFQTFRVEPVREMDDDEAVSLLKALARYFEAFPDEDPVGMRLDELVGDLKDSLPIETEQTIREELRLLRQTVTGEEDAAWRLVRMENGRLAEDVVGVGTVGTLALMPGPREYVLIVNEDTLGAEWLTIPELRETHPRLLEEYEARKAAA